MKIIIDTDIGDDIDDAYALYLLTKIDNLEILGVTTSYRNSLERAIIAKQLFKLINKDIKVFSGIDNPIDKNKAILGEKPHISQLLKEYDYDEVDGDNAVDFILEMIKKYPNEITIVEIGPSINLAHAILKDKETFSMVKSILMMGGSNNKFAEWNIRSDADAFDILLSQNLDLTLIPVDVTKHTCLKTTEEEELNNSSKPELIFLSKMLKKMHEDIPERKTTLHDVLTVSELENNFCEYKTKKLIVSLEDNKGQLIEDENGHLVKIAYSFDRKKFMDYLFNKIM